jgi:hypothetical protein
MLLLRLTALSAAAALTIAAAAFGSLTPSTYRAQANAICAHSNDQRFAVADPSPSSEAQWAKLYADTLAIARSQYNALHVLKPPTALIAAHKRALWADWYVLGAFTKIVKLPGGGARHDQATWAAWSTYATLYYRESQAWGAVGSTACQ